MCQRVGFPLLIAHHFTINPWTPLGPRTWPVPGSAIHQPPSQVAGVHWPQVRWLVAGCLGPAHGGPAPPPPASVSGSPASAEVRSVGETALADSSGVAIRRREKSARVPVAGGWFSSASAGIRHQSPFMCVALLLTPPPRATSHTRLSAHDHYNSSTLIGGKGRAGPSSLHTTLEGPMEHVNAQWM